MRLQTAVSTTPGNEWLARIEDELANAVVWQQLAGSSRVLS
jgi:hypothetical protein